MKTQKQKKEEAIQKQTRLVWKSLKIESAIKKYGFSVVKSALNRWIKYQQENAKLLKEKGLLESKLAEIENKL